MSFGRTGSRILVPLVCEGSRLAGLGDVRGYVEKLQIFYIPYLFFRSLLSEFQKKITSIFAKTEFWPEFDWKIKILRFRNDFWVLFISSSGDQINSPIFQIPLGFSYRVIFISFCEQASNWARGPKTQKFKVLRFEPNFRGRSNMTIKAIIWPQNIKKPPKNWVIYDLSGKHALPPILGPSLSGSSKFS